MGVPWTSRRRRWPSPVPIFVAFVVVAEIAFLGRLDMAKNAAMVHHWTTSFYFPSLSNSSSPLSFSESLATSEDDEFRRCEMFLEREDNIQYTRDFGVDPVLVSGAEQKDWSSCSVGCKFAYGANKMPDATFNLPQHPKTARIHRSMESSEYYLENKVDVARRRGYNIIMTTSLSSDVPVGYFSWAEYDIMAPLHPKTEVALAAAFISNCGARNFRLQALEMLEKLDIKIDSYGSCHRTREGRVDKVTTLRRYKFSLAFENSNEEDYVTEKFFQSLVAGSVPVVVGAPNIQDFAPSSSSVLHIKTLDDVASVAKTMKYLATDPTAYNQSVRWKYEGPSDSFKALVDMAAVHSSCRLCIHIATKIHEEEEMTSNFRKRPCKCMSKIGTLYHIYVRERGRFEKESIYLRSGNLSLKSLEAAVLMKFKLLNHTAVWKEERPESIRGGNDLKIYKIYPVGLTQRQALFSFMFENDADLRKHIEKNPCAKFEVIFV
ncbi:putative fucosyltransferase-like protein [Typha latifolia]|uniref:putative fucosyltransferase-like protein n=1 Tax=Typha latifolia TaxID=4733 RepID=UPI003C2FC038